MCATLQPFVDEEDREVIASEYLIVLYHCSDLFWSLWTPCGFSSSGFSTFKICVFSISNLCCFCLCSFFFIFALEHMNEKQVVAGRNSQHILVDCLGHWQNASIKSRSSHTLHHNLPSHIFNHLHDVFSQLRCTFSIPVLACKILEHLE